MAISVGDAVLKLGLDSKDLDRGLKDIGAKIRQHQKAIGIGMVAIGGVILGALGLSLKAAADFERAMREVNTMMGLSQKEFIAFSKEVQALASDLGVNAVDSAKALYQAISAGIPKENVLAFLEIATKAAIGGVTDTETAVDGLTTVINAFGLDISEAQKVADVMFTTVKGGKTTFEELSASIGMVAPAAAAMGVSYDDLFASFATMTKQGIDTAKASTSLNAVMTALIKPTDEMKSAIKELGFESADALIKSEGFAGAITLLEEKAGGSKEMLGKMFGSTEALKAIFALTGDSADLFAEDLAAIADSAGAATDAFEEMEKSISRQMEKLKESFNSIKISVGDVLIPILIDLVNHLKPIIENMKAWIAENPELTKGIVIFAGVAAGLLLVLGPLLLILPGIIAAWGLMSAGFIAMLGPVALLIAALVILGIGIYLLVQNWRRAGIAMRRTVNDITNFFKDGFEAIGGFIEGVVEKVLNLVTGLRNLWDMLMRFMGLRGGPAQREPTEEEFWRGKSRKEQFAEEAAWFAGEISRVSSRAAVIGTGEVARETMPRGGLAIGPVENIITTQIILDGDIIAESVSRHIGELTLARQRTGG